jgi:tubulin polyglutamylase TTLL1
VRSGEHKFYRDPRLSEFFAVDFIMSDDLLLYVLEVNYNPQILSVTPERIKRNYKMILVVILNNIS